MDGLTFRYWLAQMLHRRIAHTEAECATLLGRSPESIRIFKRDGTRDRAIALACAALLDRLPPFSQHHGLPSDSP